MRGCAAPAGETLKTLRVVARFSDAAWRPHMEADSAQNALVLLNRTRKDGIAVMDHEGQLVGIASRDGITSRIIEILRATH